MAELTTGQGVAPSPPALKSAVRVEGLTKVYPNGLRAVDSVSFDVKEGEVFGLLGPNGAGKTTVIKSILTLTSPTSGRIFIRSVDALANQAAVRQVMGYVPQEVSVDGDLTAYENLLIFSKLYYVDRAERGTRIREALRYMGLDERSDDLVKTFSGGMMRRLEIAQALVNRPSVLFLDEPSIGLDPAARLEVWRHVRKLNEELRTTIFLTTHDMLEADRLCHRIAIMNAGKIVVSGSPDELKAGVGRELVSVRMGGGGPGGLESGPVVLPPGFEFMKQDDGPGPGRGAGGREDVILVGGRAEEGVPQIVRAYEAARVDVSSISVSRPTLDDVFLKYTATRIGEAEEFRQAKSARRSFRKHAR
ncbi:MAG: ATP-binding cassette domain-containing protein [Nitrososphaerota archaeon]|nr:ATP-binding cassette domain-containing protein [Nitrososphaerota archaeon]MDG6974498.1 ATP-binding cassette domain-containing protein [Nitrososphaerota archaeon]